MAVNSFQLLILSITSDKKCYVDYQEHPAQWCLELQDREWTAYNTTHHILA